MASHVPLSRRTAAIAALAGALAAGVGTYCWLPATAGTPAAPDAHATMAAGALTASTGNGADNGNGARNGNGALNGNGNASATTAAPSADAPAPAHASRSKDQAAAALMALPELQAWSALLEKQSGGKTHGALIEYDATLRTVRGKTYWQFSFVENSPEAAMRWESFLLSTSDDEILVEDLATDELLSLERWRKEKQPAKRTSING